MESDVSYNFHSYTLGMVFLNLLIEYLNSISEVGGTLMVYLPPANEVCEGYVFTGVCLSTPGGCAWFYSGGMHGFIWGVCVVLFGGHAWFYWGHAWFYLGGHAWFFQFFRIQ